MSVVLDIVRTYRAPGEVAVRRASGPESEPRALAVLMAGCLLMFVAQWPIAARMAEIDPSIPLNGRLSGALMGWMFFAPLFFYALAAVSHAVARLFGGRATWYEARIALFWAFLAAGPLWLFTGLVGGFIGQGPAFTSVGVIAWLAFFVFWGRGLFRLETIRGADA